MKLESLEEVQHYQKLERAIFNLDAFTPEKAAFPQQVFNKKFDGIYFLNFNDWFHAEDDFAKLIAFLQGIGSESFYASCPPFYGLNAIQIPVNASHKAYIEYHTYALEDGSVGKGVGIRKSPEAFYYDDTQNWAMVGDLTHDILIVGLDDAVKEDFLEVFGNEAGDIDSVVNRLETFQGALLDNKERVVQMYS
jgi:hypothetical protein